MKPEIEKLIRELGLSKLFKLEHVADAGKVMKPQNKPLEGSPSSLVEPDTAEGKLPAAFIVAKPVAKPVVKTVLKPVAKPVAKPRQLEISAEEKTTKPSNWAEAIKAIFELKRKKNL